jgi:hypothetical protein
VLEKFKPFTSARTYGIVPALLQQGMKLLVPQLCRIFRACITYGFIPTAWRQVKVTFIPKPGKLDYNGVKAYNPISLLPFLLKTMQKLADRHVKDDALKKYSIHRNQHAYQRSKSTETALHIVVTRTESTIEYKDTALGAFLDIEGASDRTSCVIIKQAAENYGIEPSICRWICAMLERRNIIATLSRRTLGASVVRVCLQGSVLSPLLCSLVVDNLLLELNDKLLYTVEYADDTAILINRKLLQTLSEVLQTALCTVQQWCERPNLSINPNKTVNTSILLIRRRV